MLKWRMSKMIKHYYRYPAVRFVAVGLANFLLFYGVYLAMIQFTNYRLAYWIAVGVGLLFMSVMNIRHTFTQSLSLVSIAIYGAYYYGYSLLHVIFLTYLVERQDIYKEIAPVVTLVVLTPPHYWASKLLIKKITHPRFGNDED